ncbi:MAG TPA: MmcQ/YjbR family DNA-binding protein [Steroidobacteraceae bacterium]|nr:MmcQ/YjbR family DNA-binding protein [Steroidobacteraceae bacterium]
MTLDQVRKFALSLPEAEELPHFDRTSFRVRGKIFVTARPPETHIHIFVGDEHREPALAMYPEHVEKLFWGAKAVGLRVSLPKAPPSMVRDLIRTAWETRAPKNPANTGRAGSSA